MRIVILSSDDQFKQHLISLDEILSYQSYSDFLDYAISRGLKPVKAIRMLFSNVTEFLELQKQLRKHNALVKLLFITPFGVLQQEDLIVPYSPKLHELSIEKISLFLSESNVFMTIHRILEEEPDLLILAMPYKVIRALGILNYISYKTRTIIFCDKVVPVYNKNIVFIRVKSFSSKEFAPMILKLLKYLVKFIEEGKIEEISIHKLISFLFVDEKETSISLTRFLQGDQNGGENREEDCGSRGKAWICNQVYARK